MKQNYYLWLLSNIGFKYKDNWLEKLRALCDVSKINSIEQNFKILYPKLTTKTEDHTSYPEFVSIIQASKSETINIFDNKYPKKLLELHDPPLLLFCLGDTKLLNSPIPAISIIGSRKHSIYGNQSISIILDLFPQKSCIVVSGLAYGIDTIAHQEAVNKKLPSIAVLGSGLNHDVLYPKSNIPLSKKIVSEQGLIISEYLPTQKPRQHFFLARNRIIAGLSQATIVVECEQKSGALITAQMALDNNRDVFAIPGNINSTYSTGTNKLISQGAQILTSNQELARYLNIDINKSLQITKSNLTIEEQNVLKCIHKSPTSFDAILDLSKLDISKLLSTLSLLEIKGMVAKTISNEYYIL